MKPEQVPTTESKRHYGHFHLAGLTYWDGAAVFAKLRIGTLLTLRREAENRFDPYAVAIYYGKHKLGFVPRGENHELSKFLEMGYTSIFECRINRLSPDADPEHQVGLVVHLLPATKK